MTNTVATDLSSAPVVNRSISGWCLFMALVWACLWMPCRTEGQIEVDAYITNFAASDVSVIDTTNSAPIAAVSLGTGTQPFGAAVTPDGRFALHIQLWNRHGLGDRHGDQHGGWRTHPSGNLP
jgi:YVTN family beta-propeller protein